MTLKKIAEIVGVSVSTVSRVVNKNDTKCASQDVRDKIWDTVNATGYIPNTNAQNLKMNNASSKNTNEIKNIACVFGRSIDVNSDPFFNAIYRAIEMEAFKQGCFIKFAMSFNQLFHPSSADLLSHSNLDGLIILGRCNPEHMSFIRSKFKNIIIVALNSTSDPIDQIICDGYSVSKKAVEYLYSLGHKEIGYIGEIQNEVRYSGFIDSLNEHNLEINQSFILECPLSMESGYNTMLKLLETNIYPKAIFCCNDVTAIGVIKAISKMGLKVPKDISVISIDNIQMASYIDPILTSINIPKEEMGKMAIQILLSRINKVHKLPIKIEFPFDIKLGGSVERV